MKQATYNKDKHAWKRWPWKDIIFCTIVGGIMVAGIVAAPPGWWL